MIKYRPGWVVVVWVDELGPDLDDLPVHVVCPAPPVVHPHDAHVAGVGACPTIHIALGLAKNIRSLYSVSNVHTSHYNCHP